MVRQTPEIAESALPCRGRPVRRSLHAARKVEDGSATRIAGLGGGVLLGLFVLAILIPAVPMVAGIRLTPYTLYLLLFILPLLWRYLQDPSNRLTAADVFVALYVMWMAFAILAQYGSARGVFVVNQTVSLIGGYLVGRVLVRTAADYERLFRYIFWALVVLLPFATVELLTRQMIINEVLGQVVPVHPPAGNHIRLGFFRVQSVFENPILFGLFCSIAVANLYYVLPSSGTVQRWARTILAAFLTITSLSSAATISAGLQLALIAWDRIAQALRVGRRWIVLGAVGALALGVLQLASQGGVVGFVIENFAYDANTGWGRTEILRYGSAEVLRHPVFGIGFDDWTRPWWKKPSVDNFWLLTAMRFGLPALLFLWVAVACHILAIVRQHGLSETAARLRIGYVVAWAGLFFMLGTVHAWGAISVFVMTYLGAGAWFYAGGSAEGDETPPHRWPSDPPRRQRPVRSRPHTRVTAAQA